MVIKKTQRVLETEIGTGESSGVLKLEPLFHTFTMPKNLITYSRAYLDPGACVGFHIHNGETESYYILSGRGEYNDDGNICVVETGDLTYTPNGHGHGIKNIGSEVLEFVALILEQ